jgi:hypothetical protein
VDWAIKAGDMIVAVTEAKRENLDQGVGQNVIQLQASLQSNPKKRKFDSAMREDVMFGIVTTGVEWIVIKFVSTDDGVQVLRSSLSPFAFPINEKPPIKDHLRKRLNLLFCQLIGILDLQLALQTDSDSKRQRIL